jgi:threonine aldolase
MMNFASDNVAGASRPVLDAVIAANGGAESAYGVDAYTKRAEELLAGVFERDCAVFLVATGTAANALALSAISQPWSAIFSHAEAHVLDDECGAPEMFTGGAKIVGIPGVAGKFTPAGLEAALERFPKGVAKAVQPAAVSVSQVTEAGTLYALDEIAAIAATARRHGMATHLDGARFANALAALGCTAAEMTWKAGVDVVSFGATKNGGLACEAVVIFDRDRAADFQYRRKRSGHTLSKGRLLGAQMVGYLENGHWMDNARHANAAATALSRGLAEVEGVRLVWPTQANEVFAVLPPSVDAALKAAGVRYAPRSKGNLPEGFAIGPQESFARFVTSFASRDEDVDAILRAARGA